VQFVFEVHFRLLILDREYLANLEATVASRTFELEKSRASFRLSSRSGLTLEKSEGDILYYVLYLRVSGVLSHPSTIFESGMPRKSRSDQIFLLEGNPKFEII